MRLNSIIRFTTTVVVHLIDDLLLSLCDEVPIMSSQPHEPTSTTDYSEYPFTNIYRHCHNSVLYHRHHVTSPSNHRVVVTH